MNQQSPTAAAAPDLTSTPEDAGQARQMLETLRLARIEGRVTDRDWNARSDFLARAANGEQNVAQASPYPTQDEQFAQDYAQHMQAAKPHEYKFEWPSGIERDDAFVAFDTEIREGLAAAGVPVHLGGPILEAADRVSRELANASKEDRERRTADTVSALQALWGNEFGARRDAVLEVVVAATERSPGLGDLIDEAPWILADPAVWEFLDRVAQHRKARKA